LSNTYLERYAYPKTLISQRPHNDLGLIITIPSYGETGLLNTLQAIASCDLPKCPVEVIVVINEPANASANISDLNTRSFKESTQWAETVNSSRLQFHIHYLNDLPPKHAGVGLARKIAMDEAVRRYEHLQKPEGVIVCFDADCLCDSNFLTALEYHFTRYPKTPGCSIYFEHPLNGDLPAQIYDAIIEYELFLRYYTDALRFAGFPMAWQTIGSSMAVRSYAYQKQGGMNRRKAGEDFYFLQRIMALGNFTELNTTRVIPSPRVSDRVPFGTGRAVKDWLKDGTKGAYAPDIFTGLKTFLDHVDELYTSTAKETEQWLKSMPQVIQHFLETSGFSEHIRRIQKHSSSAPTFRKHFFQWFDGFAVLKYVHFARDHYFPNVGTAAAAHWLLQQIAPNTAMNDTRSLLLGFRKLDRSGYIVDG